MSMSRNLIKNKIFASKSRISQMISSSPRNAIAQGARMRLLIQIFRCLLMRSHPEDSSIRDRGMDQAPSATLGRARRSLPPKIVRNSTKLRTSWTRLWPRSFKVKIQNYFHWWTRKKYLAESTSQQDKQTFQIKFQVPLGSALVIGT